MRHTFSNRRNSLVILFLLATGILSSQVTIRERVTIAPVADTTHGAYHQLTEKWKALTKNAVKVNAVSPGKNKANALITLPQSGQITISVLDGASGATLDLVLRSPVQEVLLQDANNHHGFTWDTTGLPGGTTFDIGLEWHFWGESGSEYGCDVERINDSTYILGFEDLGIWPMFVDLMVLVQLGQPPQLDHFAVTVTPDTIHHFDVSTIHVQAKDALNNDIYFYNTQLRIAGNDGGTYGHVEGNWIPAETFSYRDAQSGAVRYYANGSEPDYVQNIILRVEKADDPGKNGSASITLLPGVVNHFVVTVTPDSIVYDDFAYVSALLVDDNGNEVPLDDSAPITVTATPDNVGWFYQSIPISYGDLKSGYLMYQAGPEQLFEFRDVTIKVEGPGKAGEGKLVVKPKPCLVMQLSKSTIAPGDTVELTFIQRQLDGTLAPYADDQLFFVWMNSDESYGTLMSVWGNQGSWLYGPQPFVFIAAASISTDPVTVELQAQESSGGIATSIRKEPKPELQKQAKASISKLMKILNGDAMFGGGKGTETGTSTLKEESKSSAQSKNGLALWKKIGAGGNALQGVGGCVPTGTVIVTNTEPLDHFRIRLERDTVAFTELSKIFVQAKDANDVDIELDITKLMTLSVTTNEEYATFIEKNGDTLKTSPVKLENVAYADLKSGLIKFAAVKKDPDSSIVCRMRAELSSDVNKKGDTSIVVVEQTIKILIDTPYVVRPSIPTEDEDTAKVRLRKKNLTVRMTRGGKSGVAHPFALYTDYVAKSGGHDHGDTKTVRRIDNGDNYGFFFVNDDDNGLRPWEDVTDTRGRFSINYYGSMFGDTMRIYLQSKSNRLLCDSISICEKVDSLINFRNISSNGHWIFRQSDTGVMRHQDNNWCTSEFSDSLQLAIEKFYNWTLSDENGGLAVPVSLNDMSLLLGGRYDISGLWDQRNSEQHRYHRLGTSVDVNHTLTPIQLQKLTIYMGQSGLQRNREHDKIHYGSNGGN